MSAPTITTSDKLRSLEACLCNIDGNVPLHTRFRALFTLKALKTQDAVSIISKAFEDESALLKHELAYCLGQMKLKSALPTLESVLRNTFEDPMVRHEAAEAMGAISDPSSLVILNEFLTDPARCVRETCEIAISKIKWDNSEEANKHHPNDGSSLTDISSSKFTSVDPAPPSSSSSNLLRGPPNLDSSSSQPATIQSLQSQLIDKSLPLFDRYRAMFALRNIGTNPAVDALSSGFEDDSELFKHEIAFVFGQLLSPHSVPALLKVLQDTSESDMVRHEAAEALGGIATPEVLPHLREWMNKEDAPRVVRESCQVAIDMWEYENSNEFQYADGLKETVAVA